MSNEIMPSFLKNRAFLTPDRTALFFNDQSLTFKELYEQSYQVAGKLQASGVNNGQFIGVLLKNHLDTVVILFALQLLGVKAVMLNNRLTTVELAWQLNDSNAAFLIMEDSYVKANELVTPNLTIIKKEELFSTEFELPIIQEEICLTDVCTVMYTSGTTGNPKGVLQTYGNHWWSAIGSALNLGFTDKDRWLCSVPLFHISGFSILMRSVIYGMPVVLHESFDAKRTIEEIKNKQVTIMSVVGTMLTKVIKTLGEEILPSGFRCFLLGGGPAPLPLLKACMAKEVPVYQTYGMTETSSQIVTLSPEYSLTKIGSAGKPLFPAQLKVLLEDGRVAGPNEAGEIIVKGPNVTAGYLNRQEANKDKFKNGWFYTGDIGQLDEEGFLYVLDRRSDLIISGGENIYPAEIEAVLLAHPAVSDAGVTSIDDTTWGQVPIAFIVQTKGTIVSEEELMQFCLAHLAKYKVPKRIYFINKLPRNASKKLLRRKLLESLDDGRLER
jgi:o-succinylbenzoate---CoA ligase